MSATPNSLPPWQRSTFFVALGGSLLMWAAQPPLALGWLVWVAPVPWLYITQLGDLPGRRPYRALYVAGFVYWMMAIQWLRLPHPLTSIGWVALSAYLAVYLPVFVGLSRVAIYRFAWPLWLAAPIVWTGLELARAHLLTGFLMASVAHTQVHWLTLIQVSDIVGEYGVDFLILLVAACITRVINICGRGFQAGKNESRKLGQLLFPAIPAVVSLVIVLAYGQFRIQQVDTESTASNAGPRIALIQGNSLAEWKLDPNREPKIMDEYARLSERAVAAAKEFGDGRAVDLVVWPETMFRIPLFAFDPAFSPPAHAISSPEALAAWAPRELAALVERLGTPILVGIDRVFGAAPQVGTSDESVMQQFNSAALVDRKGSIVGTYDKMHRVMFGEYIPFADWIPYLYKLTPLTGGIIAGEKPVALRLDDTYCFSPNICYETAIPHVIRRQVATLNRENESPTVLVNLTNDAWYWGSSELDMHLACDVFRAVETRVPLVIAANGGISASIDRVGRVVARSKKQSSEFLIADVEPGHVSSFYVLFGDWFASLCLACCIVLSIVEWRSRRALRSRSVPPTNP